MEVGQFYLRVLRSSAVSTSAPTLSTLIHLESCQKATFFQMLGNTGEKVLSLSSERVGLLHTLTRAPGVSLVWHSCVIQFIELHEVHRPCRPADSCSHSHSATVLQPAWCLHLLRPCPEHDHCRCYVGHLPMSTVLTLEACLTLRTSLDLANLFVTPTHYY